MERSRAIGYLGDLEELTRDLKVREEVRYRRGGGGSEVEKGGEK